MNDSLFIPGLIVLLLGIFIVMITPAIWCCYSENMNKITCCVPVVLSSILIIMGISLLVISSK